MYVISAKVKKYNANEYEWEYYQIDHSSGYPIWGNVYGAKIFMDLKDAEKEYELCKKLLMKKDVLIDTAAIREVFFKRITQPYTDVKD